MKEPYFDRVYRSTYKRLLQYAVVHLSDPTDAEDAVQNVYVDFFRRIERYGHIDILSPESYLKRMLKHEIIKHYKTRERQRTQLLNDTDEDRIIDEDAFEDAVVDRALAEQILCAAKALPAETYRTFVLYYGFERTIPEIAGLLGIRGSTVKTRLFRARTALKAQLTETHNIEHGGTEQ